MAGKPLKIGIVGGVLVIALLYSGIGYFTGAVPFPTQKRGDIVAADVCESLGDGKQAAAELEKVLPARGDYSMQDDNPPRSSDDWSWLANCTVYGEGDQLLYASTELGFDASAETWLEDSNREHGDEGRGEKFRAGRAALVMKETAEILVPCVARQGMDPLQLEVVVHAQKPLVGSAQEQRHALAAVALGTARSAHERAECPMPSKLPEKVNGLQ